MNLELPDFLSVILPVDDVLKISIPLTECTSLIAWEPSLIRFCRLGNRPRIKSNTVMRDLSSIAQKALIITGLQPNIRIE